MTVDFLAIGNREQLGEFLGLDWKDSLGRMLYGGPMERLYHRFEIPKRRGGTREISAPAKPLFEIQRKLYIALRDIYRPPVAVNGFVPKRGIVKNAIPHVGAECLVAFDIEDFFPSINFGRVRGLFMARPFRFSPDVASVLAHICCLNSALPQGAPTSPVISNMICRGLDKRLSTIARRRGCVYTRYADDVTFSGKRKAVEGLLSRGGVGVEMAANVVSEVAGAGFTINSKKTRVIDQSRSMLVTGLVTNVRLNVRRERIRRLRSFFHWIERYGAVEADRKYHELRKAGQISGARALTLERYLRGSLRHLMDVRGRYDALVQSYLRRYNSLELGEYVFDVSPDPLALAQNCHVVESVIVERHGAAKLERTPVQGTAFLISRRILLTCSHCVGDQTYIFLPQNPGVRVRAWLVARDDRADVALLRTSVDQLGAGLSVDPETKVAVGNEVTVYGFPRYALGAGMATNSARVVQFYKHFGRDRMRVSSPIVSGNSGGPVIDAKSRLVGMAATGKKSFYDDPDENDYGVVMLGALSALVARSRRALLTADPSFEWPGL